MIMTSNVLRCAETSRDDSNRIFISTSNKERVAILFQQMSLQVSLSRALNAFFLIYYHTLLHLLTCDTWLKSRVSYHVWVHTLKVYHKPFVTIFLWGLFDEKIIVNDLQLFFINKIVGNILVSARIKKYFAECKRHKLSSKWLLKYIILCLFPIDIWIIYYAAPKILSKRETLLVGLLYMTSRTTLVRD